MEIAELTCPLTYRMLEAPVIASDGFTYSSDELDSWTKERPISPLTRQPLDNARKRTNKAVAALCNCIARYRNPRAGILSMRQSSRESAEEKEFRAVFAAFRNGDETPETVLGRMRRILEGDPHNLEFLLSYLNMLRYYKDFVEADRIQRLIRSLTPSSLDLKVCETRLLMDKGDKQAAYQLLDKISVDMQDLQLKSALRYAIALFTGGLQPRGLAAVQAYTAVVDTCQVGICEYAKMCYTRGRHRDAVMAGEKALTKYPQDLDAIYYTGLAYGALGKKDRAVELFARIARGKKDRIFQGWAYYRMADLRDEKTEFPLKLEELRKAQELFPRLRADRSIAWAYLRKEMFVEACKEMEKAEDTEEETLEVKALAFERAGLRDNAVSTYRRLAGLYPDWKEVCDHRVYLLLNPPIPHDNPS